MTVEILKWDIPDFGIEFSTVTTARYELTDRSDGTLYFSAEISSRGDVPFSYAAAGYVRAKESQNRAVQDNILQFLHQLQSANLSSYVLPGKTANGVSPTKSMSAQPPPRVDSANAPSTPRIVGASFGPSTMGISVLRVENNTAASRAGLRPGDLITHINGRNIAPLYWENAVALLTASGTSVSLRLMGNEERVITFSN